LLSWFIVNSISLAPGFSRVISTDDYGETVSNGFRVAGIALYLTKSGGFLSIRTARDD
jgi:hypothetical protein